MSDDLPAPAPNRVQAMIQYFMGSVPHVAALGIVYSAHGPDWAELALPPSPRLVGYPEHGIVANGAVFALVDSAAGFAVSAARGAIGYATLDLRLDYLAAPPPGATITARMTCYRMTRDVAFVHGHAHAGDPERPIAAAAGTFMFVMPRLSAA